MKMHCVIPYGLQGLPVIRPFCVKWTTGYGLFRLRPNLARPDLLHFSISLTDVGGVGHLKALLPLSN